MIRILCYQHIYACHIPYACMYYFYYPSLDQPYKYTQFSSSATEDIINKLLTTYCLCYKLSYISKVLIPFIGRGGDELNVICIISSDIFLFLSFFWWSLFTLNVNGLVQNKTKKVAFGRPHCEIIICFGETDGKHHVTKFNLWGSLLK